MGGLCLVEAVFSISNLLISFSNPAGSEQLPSKAPAIKAITERIMARRRKWMATHWRLRVLSSWEWHIPARSQPDALDRSWYGESNSVPPVRGIATAASHHSALRLMKLLGADSPTQFTDFT